VDWVTTELLALKPLWITNNQQNLVVNFHQDFLASTIRDFFH
jgi:hypothetical protein